MVRKKKYFVDFLITYVIINLVSFGLFNYYTEKYKKIEITFYFPELFSPNDFSNFIQSSFVAEYGSMYELARNCYKLSLVSIGVESKILDFNNTEKTKDNFVKYLNEKVNSIDFSNVEYDEELDLSTHNFEKNNFCKLFVNNPFSYRHRALYFVFIFNIIHALLLLSAFKRFYSKID